MVKLLIGKIVLDFGDKNREKSCLRYGIWGNNAKARKRGEIATFWVFQTFKKLIAFW